MKNFLIVVCVIVVVCLLGYAGQYMKDDTQPVNTVASNNKQNVSTSSGTKVNNTIKKEENTVSKSEEEKVEVDNKENNKEEEEKEQIIEENSISSEEKAVQLAKKTYGNSNDVYFKIEQIISNGVYIISVRDNETTEAYVWYNVDVNTGIVK